MNNPDLVAHLESRIAERGPMSFREYMETVLYHPEYGYYSRSRSPIGLDGDFFTASNVDPVMGQLLGRLFAAMSDGISGFTLVEIGAGTGLLARHILESEPFPYIIVELSQMMRERQRETLEGFKVEWHDVLPSGIRGCVFSNEFFDALPVRRFTRRGQRVREYFVGEELSQIEADPEIHIEIPLLREGAVADISLDARQWIRSIAQSMETGYHLAIDYGYLATDFFARSGGTLMCYHNHQADENPYVDVGLKDITSHVNFSDLIDEGAQECLEMQSFCTQREFLIDLGILDLMAPLIKIGDAASTARIQALKNLLLPPMMGDRFRVLLQRKGIARMELPGFGRSSS